MFPSPVNNGLPWKDCFWQQQSVFVLGSSAGERQHVQTMLKLLYSLEWVNVDIWVEWCKTLTPLQIGSDNPNLPSDGNNWPYCALLTLTHSPPVLDRAPYGLQIRKLQPLIKFHHVLWVTKHKTPLTCLVTLFIASLHSIYIVWIHFKLHSNIMTV